MRVLRKSAELVLTTLVVLTAAGPASGMSEPAPTAGAAPDGPMGTWVAQRADDLNVPGVAWAVVSAEKVEAAGAYGTDGDGRAMTTTTPTVWGSVSKPITATLLVMLDREGVLDLDDRVRTYLPDFGTADPVTDSATLRQLLTHTAGLPTGLELLDDAGARREPRNVVAQLADLEPVGPPGDAHHYSGLGYVTLAAVVEEVAGESFGEVLEAHDLPHGGADELTGHRFVAGQAMPWTTDVDHASAAAGYLTGSVDELASFARTQLPGGPGLDDAERAELHTPHVETGPEAGYGLGWRVSTPPGATTPMTWHGGATPGFATMLALVPGTDRAVVVAADAYGPWHDAALMAIGGGLAALVAGEAPQPVGTGATYVVALAGLVGLGLVLLALGWLLWRGSRRRVRPGRLHRWPVPFTALGCAGSAVVAMLVLPNALGVNLGQLVLWVPDIAWLTWTNLALGVLLGSAALVALVVRGRGRASR